MFSHWMSTASAVAAANLANAGSNAGGICAPPDVLLEVGPSPYVRYAAHSSLLAAHSGYLRSALRAPAANPTTTSSSNAGHPSAYAAPENTTSATASSSSIFLPNITADQFGPLLSYMYSGYLDLNVDNIFAVLLAAHVLHMPRAAELCRTYLTRGNQQSQLLLPHHPLHQPQQPPPFPPPAYDATFGTSRIIRPIASKAPHSGGTMLEFAAPLLTATRLRPSKDTPFRALLQQQQPQSVSAEPEPGPGLSSSVGQPSEDIPSGGNNTKRRRCTLSANQSPPTPTQSIKSQTTDEQCQQPLPSTTWPPGLRLPSPPLQPLLATGQPEVVTIGEVLDDPVRFNEAAAAHKPLLAHTAGGSRSKTIIDIASCDGPVRFRRVLNEAYGLGVVASQITTSVPSNAENGGCADNTERSAQLVASSFHLQMAKNISGEQLRMRSSQQQHQHQQQHFELAGGAFNEQQLGGTSADDESENSQQEIHVSAESRNPEPPAPSPTRRAAATATAATTTYQRGGVAAGAIIGPPTHAEEQLYACVYCKHTFKSQYCFQKHAKRHINPLTIDDPSDLLVTTTTSTLISAHAAAADEDEQQLAAASGSANSPVASGGSGSGSGARKTTTIVRREVRPLDMNVQYYPCKTCGSKFPSYYFVHKHRKLCHANEEN